MYQDILGKWYPDGGVPRNNLESDKGLALWNIRNVFKGTDDDMCDKLLRAVSQHEYESSVCRVALVGPSGCGKTYALRQLAKGADAAGAASVVKAVIDMDFSGQVMDGIRRLQDHGVSEFEARVQALCLPVRDPTDLRHNAENIKAVTPIVEQFLVARLVLLQVIRGARHIPRTAEAFYLAQRSTWGREVCLQVLKGLDGASSDTVHGLLQHLMGVGPGGQCVLALDEAGVAAVDLFPNLFKSSEDLTVSRGILGPILASVPGKMAVVVAGTILRLPELAVLGSGLKPDQVYTLCDFPTMTPEQSKDVLQQLLKAGAAADRVVQLLSGKGRYLEFLFGRIGKMSTGSAVPTSDDELVAVARSVRDELVLRGVKKLEDAMSEGALRLSTCLCVCVCVWHL